MKKCHEKKLVLRNINLHTITVTKNAFERYHVKYNLDLLAYADDTDLDTLGIYHDDCIPSELHSHVEYSNIIIDSSLYRDANKIHLDYYALGQVLDSLRIVFDRKNTRLAKLIADLTENYPSSYQPCAIYFKNFFKTNANFYLNMVARKFAGREVNLMHDAFLSILKDIRKIYFLTTQFVDFINLLENKHHPATTNNIVYKLIQLKTELESFNKISLKTFEIKHAITNIENIVDKIIQHYKNIMIQQLCNHIIMRLQYTFSEKMKNTLFSDTPCYEQIYTCLHFLYHDNMLNQLNHISMTECMTMLMIMNANIEKYIKMKGQIPSSQIVNIIYASFILSYKLHIDKQIKMNAWSKWLDVSAEQLNTAERAFLIAINHELIHDPFFSTYQVNLMK